MWNLKIIDFFCLFQQFIPSRISCKKFKAVSLILPEWQPSVDGLGGFQRLKTGTFLLFFFLYISNEIFYSNSLPYKRYIFKKYFVKFLLQNFENSVIGTSSPVTSKKKFSRRSQDNSWQIHLKLKNQKFAVSRCL